MDLIQEVVLQIMDFFHLFFNTKRRSSRLSSFTILVHSVY